MSTVVVLNGVPTEDAAVGYTLSDSSGSGLSGSSGSGSSGSGSSGSGSSGSGSSGSGSGSVSCQRWEISSDGDHWAQIQGATSSTFTPGDAEVGRFLRVAVSIDKDGDGDIDDTAKSGPVRVVNVNDAPGGTLTASGTAKQGETVTAVDAVTDADGIPAGGRGYHWQVQGGSGAWTDIAGATGTAFTLTEAEVGRAVRVVLAYTDRYGKAETVAGAATAVVENVDDEPQGVLAINGEAVQGATLTLADAVTDVDGVLDTSRGYEWQVRGEDGAWTTKPGAWGSAFTLTQAEVGRSVRAVMSYVDGHGNREWFVTAPTAAVGNTNDAPDGALTVSGDAVQGEVLSLADAVTDADGMLNAIREYRWQAQDENGSWADIAGATAATFALTQSEVGRPVRGVLVYQDDQGQREALATDGTAPVENANDAPAGMPVLLAGPGGAVLEGVSLAADLSGVSDADGMGAFAYAWFRDDGQGGWTAIAGAHGPSYAPSDGDVGALLKVEARYTDGFGKSETLAAVAPAAVANVNDTPVGAVVLAGRPVRGGAIAASTASLADADGMGAVSLRWERQDGQAWTPIAGATGAAYTPAADDVGHVLRAVAAWTDGHGTPETAVAETDAVAARVIALPAPEGGEDGWSAAADEWTSTGLGAMIADGGVFVPPPGVESVRLADGVLSFGPHTAEAFIARLYLGLLGREGDAEGLASAARALEDGFSRTGLARLFLSSAEHGTRYGEQTDTEFVQGLYDAFLGRGAAAAERGSWTAALDAGLSRAEVAAAIAGSAEAADRMQASTAGVFVADAEGIAVRSLYRCALGREAEGAGLRYWSDLLERGIGPRGLGEGFDGAPEFAARHGGGTDEAFVRALYMDGVGRDPDAPGLEHWLGLLASGRMGRGEVAFHFSATPEARAELDWAL